MHYLVNWRKGVLPISYKNEKPKLSDLYINNNRGKNASNDKDSKDGNFNMEANNQGNKKIISRHGNSGLNSHATQSGLRNEFFLIQHTTRKRTLKTFLKRKKTLGRQWLQSSFGWQSKSIL